MPILFLTGLGRCGSTWTAQGLTALTGARYVHEPFNRHLYPQLVTYAMRYQSAEGCDPDFLRILDQKLRAPSRRQRIREFFRGRNLIFKDVNACLSVECIQAHLNAGVVILTRHPCAVVASWKVMGWLLEFPGRFDELLSRTSLRKFLTEFDNHMRRSSNLFFQFGAYWGAIYHVLQQLATRHPEWQWVVHEQLCQNPEIGFQRILDGLGIRVREGASDFFSMHDRPLRKNESPYETFRPTKSVPQKWKELLTKQEIQAVLDGAEPFRPDDLLLSHGVTSADALIV
jgi:Sulfotransferase domain